jgi:hypothetical protein
VGNNLRQVDPDLKFSFFTFCQKSFCMLLELLHRHLGFIFLNIFPCLLVIISHYSVSYILGENIPPGQYSLQLTLQFD